MPALLKVVEEELLEKKELELLEKEGSGCRVCFLKLLKQTTKMQPKTLNRLLKTGSAEKLSDADVEESLEKSVALFSYLTDNCQLRKVRVPMALLEDSHNVKKVEEDRSIAIEAAIARKSLSHQKLVAEVLTQLAFFRPDPK
ncbi:unnamed protein product, partial [Sphagnum compactum]